MSANQTRLTERDLDVLAVLDRTPLTAQQLLKLSRTFRYPFTAERRVRERLTALCAAGRVRRWLYATAGPGAPAYYTLTRLGHQLLYGRSAVSLRRRDLLPVAIAHQHHAFSLAEFIVHTLVASHGAGVTVSGFVRGGGQHFLVGDDVIVPDTSFQLTRADGTRFSYFVEIDCATERIRSDTSAVSWERKINLYERLQDARDGRFRVLAVATRGFGRIPHILELAHRLARNPKRALIYAVTLADYLAATSPLFTPIFRDHGQRPVALLPGTSIPSTVTPQPLAALLP